MITEESNEQPEAPAAEPAAAVEAEEVNPKSEEGNDAETEAAELQAEADATAEPVKDEIKTEGEGEGDEDDNNEVVNSAVNKATTAPKSTASVSRVAQLEARIAKDPLDGEAQLALLADAEAKGDLERTREVYERFLKVFPEQVSTRYSAG